LAKHKPHYDLPKVQELVNADQYVMVKSATKTAAQLGFNQARIKDALLSIRLSDFSKSEPDWQFKGYWQDAYKPCYEGIHLYIKWKKVEMNGEGLLVLSFKKNTADDI
jgi:hypothetical protein